MFVESVCQKARFLLFGLVGNVYEEYNCVPVWIEPKPVRKRTGPPWTQANLRSRNETGLIWLPFSTCVNIALGEFRGWPYNTIFYQIKNFLVCLRPVPGEYFTEFPSSCNKIYDMWPKHHQCVRTKFTKILSDSAKCWLLLRNEDVVGLNWFKYVDGQTLGNILCNFQ